MEINHSNSHYPILSVFTSIFSTMLAWSIKDVQVYASLSATLVAIASGILAIRYYWFAGNEKKKKLKSKI